MTRFEKIRSRVAYQALFEEKSIREAIDFALSKGFRAVEVNLVSPTFSPERYSSGERKRTKEYSEQKQIVLLLHAPEGLNLLNPQRTVREASLKRMGELLGFASEIGAKRLTFHLGYCEPVSVGGELVRLYQLFPEVYEEMAEEVFTYLAHLHSEGVKLCLENCGGFKYGVVRKALRRNLSSDGLHLTWDIGHTNRLKGRDREEEEKFYSQFLNKIGNCHLHDNSGEWDEHNIIGKGNVDFPKYLRMLADLDVYFVLEVRPRDRALLSLKALENLRAKLSD